MRRILPLFLSATLALAGCGGDPPDGSTTTPTTTNPDHPDIEETSPTVPPRPSSDELWASCAQGGWVVEVVGELDAHLTSVSGLAASWRHDGIVWAIEDSLEPPAVTAIDRDGGTVATVTLAGHPLMNLDWEDLAVKPGPDGTPWIHVPDIGDNFGVRTSVQVHRFPEPDLADATITPETISARYEDGRRRNAEAFLVDTDGTAWVVDKVSDAAATVFRLDTEGGVLRATGIVDTGAPVTAVDLSADGGLVALRTSEHVRLHRHEPGADLAATLAGEPCELPAPDEVQGESLAFLRGEHGLVSVSEDERGAPVTLHRIVPGT